MSNLSELEMTRLCAMAMFDALEWEQRLFDYNPLTDDAQAMALAKRFYLNMWSTGPEDKRWRVMFMDGPDAWAADLNRAICECVAKMQAAK